MKKSTIRSVFSASAIALSSVLFMACVPDEETPPGQAALDIADTLQFSGERDGDGTDTVEIMMTNTGDAELSWSIALDDGGDCNNPNGGGLVTAVTPSSGTVAANSSDPVTATVTFNGLPGDVLGGYLCLTTNDANNTLKQVTVNLTLTCVPGETYYNVALDQANVFNPAIDATEFSADYYENIPFGLWNDVNIFETREGHRIWKPTAFIFELLGKNGEQLQRSTLPTDTVVPIGSQAWDSPFYGSTMAMPVITPMICTP